MKKLISFLALVILLLTATNAWHFGQSFSKGQHIETITQSHDRYKEASEICKQDLKTEENKVFILEFEEDLPLPLSFNEEDYYVPIDVYEPPEPYIPPTNIDCIGEVYFKDTGTTCIEFANGYD